MDARSPAADACLPDRLDKEDHHSDSGAIAADTVSKIVMAEQITHDVVKEAQSMGGPTLIDDTATSTSTPAGDGEAPSARTNVIAKTSEALPNPSINATSTEAANEDGVQESDKKLNHQSGDRLVNGDSGEHSASEEGNSAQGPGDVSGGSDTDISRPGSVDPAKETIGGHLRSNSFKKPASFKSVSVTKNFLAKSAVSTPAARPGEKAASPGQAAAPTQLVAKPRLVAKSGSGMNMSRSSLSKVNGAGSGPDASKVWNKNQPVPIAPPKQFTDEELKQQYGIHLATRLQADESSKEAKWADIDDDEDDWAPDTVQWMDGTKSTVAVAEEQAPPEEPAPTVVQPEPPVEPAKPTASPAPTAPRPSSTSGTKTILKPGAHSQGSSKTGLVLKGQPEKPTLVAKPSGPTAVKSPWAPLPPVERIPPVQINPPVQQAPPPRFSQRDSHGYDAPLTSVPAKEIAPDDFNRSWRDERVNRELFNSHSGRYEPVNETRRGSVRDGFRHQPAVLQRPSNEGPAEPSAAFQTSRTSGSDAPAWGRRRNSSNVSGGSGRRMSIDRRPEILPAPLNMQRRGSHSLNGTDALSPGTPRHAFPAVPEQPLSSAQMPSPNISNVQPVSPLGSVASSANPETAASGVAPPLQSEDPVEVQNRLMREKLERARLAKQKQREQEEKEEAERKERLRKKLEAMGMGDDAKLKPKEQSPSRSAERSPQKTPAVPVPVQSPPKPPVPTSEGEVAQYGMMKVHQPHPVKKPFHDVAAPKPLRPADAGAKQTSLAVKQLGEAQAKATTTTTTIASNSIVEPSGQAATPFNRENRNNKSPMEQTPVPAQHAGAEGEARAGAHVLKSSQPPPAAWSAPSLPQQPQPRPWASNVWGPPQTKDRALGNGTFDSNYNPAQRSSPQQLSAQSKSGQAPSLVLNSQLKPSPPSQPQTAPTAPFQQPAMFTKSESAPAQQANAAPKPGPIAPPADKGWGNFAAAIKLDDQAMVVKARQELERIGGESFRPELRETYTDRQGRSHATLHSKVGGHNSLPKSDTQSKISQTAPELKAKDESIKVATEASATQAAIVQGAHLQSAGQNARPSRFFPRPSDSVAQSSATSSSEDSPPPPETESHPAFTGDTSHPVVKMPKPSPRVRLPPAATETAASAEAPVSMPSRARLGLGARPLALNPEWQARFNSLLEKPGAAPVPVPISRPSPPIEPAVPVKVSALAVAASSKAPLEVRGNIAAATVSLPRKTFTDDGSSETITRVSAETVLLEEREFGSLPVVKPPKVPHLASNEPPAGFPPNRPNSRFHRSMDIFTKPTLNILDYEQTAEGIDVKIRVGNMQDVVVKTVAKRRGNAIRKGPGNKGPKRNFTPNNTTPNAGQPPRPRKPSSYQGQASSTNNPPRSSGSNGWNSNRSTPPHNNSTWTRRAAPVH